MAGFSSFVIPPFVVNNNVFKATATFEDAYGNAVAPTSVGDAGKDTLISSSGVDLEASVCTSEALSEGEFDIGSEVDNVTFSK